MEKNIPALFGHTADAFPAHIAVEEEGNRITYQQLDIVSNRIAHACLQKTGNNTVLVLLPRGIELIAAMLGIWKAGHVYMPASWQLGDITWKRILEEVQPGIIITTASEVPALQQKIQRLGSSFTGQVLLLDKAYTLEMLDAAYEYEARELIVPASRPAVTAAGNDSAYLFFSSGTTGTPKIIEGRYKSLAHFICWQQQAFQYNAASRVSQIAAPTFDASLKDFLPALLSGGTVCIPPAAVFSNMHLLLQWLHNSHITVMATVPSIFRALLQEAEQAGGQQLFPAMQYCLLAGEVLYYKDVYRWQKAIGTQVQLVNLYGTTESTILKSWYRVNGVKGKMSDRVPAGQPIANTLLLVINEEGNLCQPGEEGDVYIKTPFLTKGYFRDAAATDAIFVNNPLVKEGKDVVYKTGDRGYFQPDGNLMVCGRKDNQKKIRGVRIDLSGVEATLLQHPQVKQAKCLVLGDEPEQEQLVACYSAAGNLSPEALTAFLQPLLNAYELPAVLQPVAMFPVNKHGKTDTDALMSLLQQPAHRAVAQEPVTAIEKQLLEVCRQLFKKEEIAITDNFFQLGGNSLKAIQLGALITRKMNITLGVEGLRLLFEKPVLQDFAAALEQRTANTAVTTVAATAPAVTQQLYPLSFAQEQVWMASQTTEGNKAHNMSQSFRVQGYLQPDLLRQALLAVAARHEILRTRFIENNGAATQQVTEGVVPEQVFYYKEVSDSGAAETVAAAWLEEVGDVAFDLTLSGQYRLALAKVANDTFLLGITVHHIIGDSWSGQVIARELLACYQALAENKKWLPAALTTQYKEVAQEERNRLQGAEMERLEAYWMKHLGNRLPELALTTDFERPRVRTQQGARLDFEWQPGIIEKLSAFAVDNGMSQFSILLAAFFVTLYKYTGNQEIIAGIPVATRNSEELLHQIGIYVNTIAQKGHIQPALPAMDFMKEVAAAFLKGYEHQAYPFQRLVQRYGSKAGTGHNPVFDVAINMLTGAPAEAYGTAGIHISDFNKAHRFSKFDVTLYVYDDADKGLPFIEYNTALFQESTISRFAVRYQALLLKMLQQPHQSLQVLLQENIRLPKLTATSL